MCMLCNLNRVLIKYTTCRGIPLTIYLALFGIFAVLYNVCMTYGDTTNNPITYESLLDGTVSKPPSVNSEKKITFTTHN